MSFAACASCATAGTVASRDLPNGYIVRRGVPVRHGDTLLAVNTRRLIDYEIDWDIQIELVPMVDTPVHFDGVVFRTSTPVSDDRATLLLEAVAFGDTYSPASGPFGAIRSMVDIALKALPPAVNDSTRAVQALDHIEDILTRMAPRVAADETALEGNPDASLIRSWSRSWEDYVAAATDEIRQAGTTTVQVQRRLLALYTSLLDKCLPQQHPPLQRRLDALQRGIDQWWSDPLDRALASGIDPQGLGTAGGVSPSDVS